MNENSQKSNPWMLSTILLVGLIIGFTIGKYMPTSQITNTTSKSVTAQSDINTETTVKNPATPTSTTSQPPLEPVNYENIEKSKDTNGHWTLGSKNAKVTIEEYSDFQCPYCHQYFSETFPLIFKNYIATGKVYYIYYNYPLYFHPQAKKAAEASLCAGDQEKYWEMHDALFESQSTWGNPDDIQVYQQLAKKLGLNESSFSQCLNSNKYTAQIEKDLAAGKSKKVTGTPTFFLNGEQKIVGAQDYTDFENAIETLLNQ